MQLISFVRTDGGREASGRDRIGKVGDCVIRAATLLQANRTGIDVSAFVADGTDSDIVGSLYDETWHALNGAQSEYVAQRKLDGAIGPRRGWATSVDRGTYPKVWRPMFEKVFGFRKQVLGRTKPTLSEAFNSFGPCVISMSRHIFALLPTPNGAGAQYDTGDVRTYLWEHCGEHNPDGRGSHSLCDDYGYADCYPRTTQMERKAISLWTP